jgi:hypothetical protein
MAWVLVVALLWVLLAMPMAVVVGRGIRLADKRAMPAPWTDQVEEYLREQASASP